MTAEMLVENAGSIKQGLEESAWIVVKALVSPPASRCPSRTPRDRRRVLNTFSPTNWTASRPSQRSTVIRWASAR